LASAYTPGLTVSSDIVVRKTRRLPIKGEVLVAVGQDVTPEQVIARAMLPGPLQTVKLAEKLGLEAKDAVALASIKVGDQIEKGKIIAETKGFLGKFKSTVVSDHTGTVEQISALSGNVLVREASVPVDVTAYVRGKIASVLEEEGAIVETRCAMVQGIFGVGSERHGTIRLAVADPSEILEAKHIQDSDSGKILIGGSGVTLDALRRASAAGVVGLIGGGVKDSDLTQFLGFEIGVAITGQEAITVTLLVTEGFGFLNMAQRTFDLLKSLEGQEASMNGATQIRAGVIRPEIICPHTADSRPIEQSIDAFMLQEGTSIRVIREPFFGRLGTVTELPSQLVTVDSGTEVRVLRAKLENGEEVTVPRANVEIIAAT
jgi:hypothetical protein